MDFLRARRLGSRLWSLSVSLLSLLAIVFPLKNLLFKIGF